MCNSNGVLQGGHERDGQYSESFESVALDKSSLGDSDDPNIVINLGGSIESHSICITKLNLCTSKCVGTVMSGDKRKRGRERVRNGKMDNDNYYITAP